eukprot:TRINITY_DN22636_c0_g1_i2.p1 TRINITY_DN22636_c0_g1~~TRINITY_DN22636_c0_g1_i2.p1  ORF type:complete len:194 (+),score=46.37 TRINITY_DN22636_c0_g1_i2:165-746(+)
MCIRDSINAEYMGVGNTPFHGATTRDVLESNRKNYINFDANECRSIRSDLKELIASMMKEPASRRPTAKEIMKHIAIRPYIPNNIEPERKPECNKEDSLKLEDRKVSISSNSTGVIQAEEEKKVIQEPICIKKEIENTFDDTENGLEVGDENTGSIESDISIKYLSYVQVRHCLLYTSPSPRDLSTSRMPSSA